MIPSHRVSDILERHVRRSPFVRFTDTYRCVKGQGMINMRTHDTGDLIIQFDVEFPPDKSLTDAQVLKVSGTNALPIEMIIFYAFLC